MEIRIVNTDKTPMWAIPDTDVFLSSEENNFLEIDYSILTPYQQQTLWSALKMKTIEAKDDKEFQIFFRSMLKDYLNKRQEQLAPHLFALRIDLTLL